MDIKTIHPHSIFIIFINNLNTKIFYVEISWIKKLHKKNITICHSALILAYWAISQFNEILTDWWLYVLFMQDFPEIIERMYAGYSFIFWLILLILFTWWHIIFIIEWKRRNYSKSSIFFALVFLNVSWISIDLITYKNIIAWAKVHYSMKEKEGENMSIINVIMLSLFRKCLVALLRVFVVFLIFFLWFKGNSSNILDAGLFLLYFFWSFSMLFSPI